MVETGKRIITSNLPITPGPGGEFSDVDDAEAEISDPAASRRDLPLSTAAHMSARFTYVSPRDDSSADSQKRKTAAGPSASGSIRYRRCSGASSASRASATNLRTSP